MTAAPSHLDRFIRAVHHRAVLLRMIERAGLGLFVGTMLALMLTLLLWWQGRPAMAVSLVSGGCGLAAGLAWGIFQRPSSLEAALLADRQLRLDDLLATAISVSKSSDEDQAWARTVVAIADARVSTRSPSEVVLARLGLRAWSGIGLASALAITLAALASSPGDSRATTERNETTSDGVATSSSDRHQPLMLLGPESPRVANIRPSGPEERSEGIPLEANPSTPSKNADTQPGGQGDELATPSPSDGIDKAGAGQSSTSRPYEAGRPPPPVGPPDGIAPDRPQSRPTQSSTRTSAGGAGSSNDSVIKKPGMPAGTSGGISKPRAPVPPWQSDSWTRDVQNAQQALEADRIPAAYRDLVRDYFERK